MSCRRQEMLTQGPAPGSKCKLNISSFFSLPNLLDCLICTRNSVSIVLLLWTIGVGVDSYQGVSRGSVGGYYLIVCFFTCAFVFCCLMTWVQHDSCCVCFFVYYLFSLLWVPLTRKLLKLFIKSVSDHYAVDFDGKERVF